MRSVVIDGPDSWSKVGTAAGAAAGAAPRFSTLHSQPGVGRAACPCALPMRAAISTPTTRLQRLVGEGVLEPMCGAAPTPRTRPALPCPPENPAPGGRGHRGEVCGAGHERRRHRVRPLPGGLPEDQEGGRAARAGEPPQGGPRGAAGCLACCLAACQARVPAPRPSLPPAAHRSWATWTASPASASWRCRWPPGCASAWAWPPTRRRRWTRRGTRWVGGWAGGRVAVGRWTRRGTSRVGGWARGWQQGGGRGAGQGGHSSRAWQKGRHAREAAGWGAAPLVACGERGGVACGAGEPAGPSSSGPLVALRRRPLAAPRSTRRAR